MLREPRLELLCELTALLEPVQEIGETPHGNRHIIYVKVICVGMGTIIPGGVKLWVYTVS